MSPLLFTCPETHQQASTGIETDAQSLRSFWKATLKSNAHIAAGYMTFLCGRRTSITLFRIQSRG